MSWLQALGGVAFALLTGTPTGHRPQPPVQIVEFSDFTCSYCRRFALQVLPALKREYAGRVSWSFVPVTHAKLTGAEPAARAADCVAAQGDTKFWHMHDLLFRKQHEWFGPGEHQALFTAYAVASGASRNQFVTCFKSYAAVQRLAADNERARQMQVRIRPTFFVNGRRVEGALDLADFRALLNAALRQQRSE